MITPFVPTPTLPFQQPFPAAAQSSLCRDFWTVVVGFALHFSPSFSPSQLQHIYTNSLLLPSVLVIRFWNFQLGKLPSVTIHKTGSHTHTTPDCHWSPFLGVWQVPVCPPTSHTHPRFPIADSQLSCSMKQFIPGAMTQKQPSLVPLRRTPNAANPGLLSPHRLRFQLQLPLSAFTWQSHRCPWLSRGSAIHSLSHLHRMDSSAPPSAGLPKVHSSHLNGVGENNLCSFTPNKQINKVNRAACTFQS